MATSIMGNHPVAPFAKKKHLRIPRIRAERPTMRENYGMARAPILVIDLRTVFDFNRFHLFLSVLTQSICRDLDACREHQCRASKKHFSTRQFRYVVHRAVRDSRWDDQFPQGPMSVVRWVTQSADFQRGAVREDATDVAVSAESPLAVVLAHPGISYAAKR